MSIGSRSDVTGTPSAASLASRSRADGPMSDLCHVGMIRARARDRSTVHGQRRKDRAYVAAATAAVQLDTLQPILTLDEGRKAAAKRVRR